jgi:hypothetical protein
LAAIISRNLKKVSMMLIFTLVARSLRNAVESMATPCLVKANTLGACLIPELVTVYDKFMISLRSRESMKSSGNRIMFLRTA